MIGRGHDIKVTFRDGTQIDLDTINIDMGDDATAAREFYAGTPLVFQALGPELTQGEVVRAASAHHADVAPKSVWLGGMHFRDWGNGLEPAQVRADGTPTKIRSLARWRRRHPEWDAAVALARGLRSPVPWSGRPDAGVDWLTELKARPPMEDPDGSIFKDVTAALREFSGAANGAASAITDFAAAWTADKPTAEGLRRHPPDGIFDLELCTCSPECTDPCTGWTRGNMRLDSTCRCEACAAATLDNDSGDWE